MKGTQAFESIHCYIYSLFNAVDLWHTHIPLLSIEKLNLVLIRYIAHWIYLLASVKGVEVANNFQICRTSPFILFRLCLLLWKMYMLISCILQKFNIVENSISLTNFFVALHIIYCAYN